MKKKNLNFLLIALAALALVFAGACSDGSDDDGTTTTPSDGTVYCDTCTANTCTVTTDCTGKPGCTACSTNNCTCSDCAKIEINMTYFKAFVAGITDTIAANDGGSAYWTFTGGEWADSDLEYTLAGVKGENSAQVSASAVEGKVQDLGDNGKVTSDDGLLEIDFSSVTFESGTATSSTDGKIVVTVTLTSDAGENGSLAGTYTIDSDDTSLNGLSGDGVSVTLVFKDTLVTSSNSGWTT